MLCTPDELSLEDHHGNNIGQTSRADTLYTLTQVVQEVTSEGAATILFKRTNINFMFALNKTI